MEIDFLKTLPVAILAAFIVAVPVALIVYFVLSKRFRKRIAELESTLKIATAGGGKPGEINIVAKKFEASEKIVKSASRVYADYLAYRYPKPPPSGKPRTVSPTEVFTRCDSFKDDLLIERLYLDSEFLRNIHDFIKNLLNALQSEVGKHDVKETEKYEKRAADRLAKATLYVKEKYGIKTAGD